MKIKLLLLLFFLSFSLSAADSLFLKVNTSWILEKNVSVLEQKAKSYLAINLDTALAFGYTLFQSEKATVTQKAKSYLYIGMVLSEKGEYINASLWLEKGLHFIKGKNIYLEARFYQELGRHEKIKQNYEISLEYALTSLKIFETLNDYEKQAEVHINIAEFYRSMARFIDAEEYIEKALEICTEHNIKNKTLVYLYGRAAAIKVEQNFYKAAAEYSFKALEVAEKNGLKNEMATSYNELGLIFHDTEHEKSLKYYQKAYKIWKDIGADIYTIRVQLNIGRYYVKNKNYLQAIKVLEEAQSIAEKNNWTAMTQEIYTVLFYMYKNKKDYENALKYILLSGDVDKLARETQYGKDIREIRVKYETEKNELLLSETKTALDRQVMQRNLSILGVFLLILFLGIVVYSRSKVQKSNKKILEAKAEIEKINSALNKEVYKKEALLKEVNHRVKNNLTILSGLFYLQESETQSPETITLLRESQMRIKSMAMIHENLYQEDNSHSIDMNVYYEKLAEELLYSLAPQDKEIELDIKAENVDLELVYAVPLTLIINELITNSCKYAFTNRETGFIKLRLTKENNIINACYCDDGIGLPQNIDLENVDSFGLRLIHLLVSQLKGKLEYQFDEGAKFTISFPLKIS